MRRLALGVVLGVVLVGCSGGSSTSSVSSLVDTDAMADYLVDVLESESDAGFQDAFMALEAAVNIEEVVTATRQLGDAYGRKLQILELLTPPTEAAANHQELLDLTSQSHALFPKILKAMEEGDRLEIDRLEVTIALSQGAEAANILQRQVLIGEVLSEKSDPLSEFMSAVVSIDVTWGGDFQKLFTELETLLNTGGNPDEELYASLERISGDISTAWSELTPPEEAKAFHSIRANELELSTDALTAMKEAYANEDPTAIEQASRQRTMVLILRTQVQNLETELLVLALKR